MPFSSSLLRSSEMVFPPLLSICISTLNRMQKSVILVENLLACQDSRIEVVVNDNKSCDNTLVHLHKISDRRLKVIASETNLGSDNGFFKAVSRAEGIFIMVCLDKDIIEPSLLPYLCDELQQLSSVGMGFCNLDSRSITPPKVFSRGFDAVQQMAYIVRHPTGYIFRREIFIETHARLRKVLTAPQGFELERIIADICLYYDAVIFNAPIVCTETKEEAKDCKSLTYNASSAWFLPRQRFHVLKFFLLHLSTLNLPSDEKFQIVNRIFNENLKNVTDVLGFILDDVSLCKHYGVEPRMLSSAEKNLNELVFCMHFMLLSGYPSLIDKLRIMKSSSAWKRRGVKSFIMSLARKVRALLLPSPARL